MLKSLVKGLVVFSLLVALLLLSIFAVLHAYATSSVRNSPKIHNANITCAQIRADETKLNTILNNLQSVKNDGIGSTLLPSSVNARFITGANDIAQYKQELGVKASSLGC